MSNFDGRRPVCINRFPHLKRVTVEVYEENNLFELWEGYDTTGRHYAISGNWIEWCDTCNRLGSICKEHDTATHPPGRFKVPQP